MALFPRVNQNGPSIKFKAVHKGDNKKNPLSLKLSDETPLK